MATAPLPASHAYPTVVELRSLWLDSARQGYALRGNVVNVSEGSDLWIRADASARVAMLALQNGRLGLKQINPYEVTGDDLVALAAVYGVRPRPASKSKGLVIVSFAYAAPDVTITAGFKGTHATSGAKYVVAADRIVGDGETVLVEAVVAGAAGDAAAGSIIKWDSASIGRLKQAAVVAAGGIDGGSDADTEADLRRRLLRRLGLPAVGGNAAHTAELAEAASAAVNVAFVYPSAMGPASSRVAILGEAPDLTLNATIQGDVELAVRGAKPGETLTAVSSIKPEAIDVVIDLRLPQPKAVGGLGGGWLDGAAWPSDAESGVKGRITNIAVVPGQVSLTVDSTAADPPTPGRRCAVWLPESETFMRFAIVSTAGSPGAYTIFTDLADDAAADLAVGMYVSPDAVNLDGYAEAFRDAMLAMGPGELTDNMDLLRFARRFPSQSFDYPSALTSRQLAPLEAFGEVEGTSYAARYETETTTTRTEPSVPPTTMEAPRQLTLAHLAFRRAT
ncbi:MAG: baseplate J/gp47 family protein [Polyangiaceae bacterium]